MNAYFDTLRYLMILMFILMLFSLPAMFIYSRYNALEHQDKYIFNKFALGNMGKIYFISNYYYIQVDLKASVVVHRSIHLICL
jgi:hypothetical protein